MKTKDRIWFCPFIVMGLVLLLTNCCKKEEEKVPTIITTIVTNITKSTATSGGTITDEGSGTILARGVCWNMGNAPTITDNKTTVGTGTEAFTSIINDLTPGTTYNLSAYATNSAGTAYGDVFSFKTYNSDAIQDIDGNYYNIVTIGSQIWMGENLRTTNYSDGQAIPLITDNVKWSNLNTPGYSWYNNTETFNKAIYGALYNWYTVNTGKLCPTGWHVPTHDEWKQMEMHLGMSQEEADKESFRGTYEGHKLKATYGWNQFPGYEANGNNASGFTAFPGGERSYYDGSFWGRGIEGYWFTATRNEMMVYCRGLRGDLKQIDCHQYPQWVGFAVRCIKD